MTALIISNIVLWVLQIATIVVVVGLARQVGVLHLRLPAHGAGQTDDGPQVGQRLDVGSAVTVRGEQTQVLVPGKLSVIMLASSTCGACAPTMEAVMRLREVEKDVNFVVAIDGDQGQALPYAASYGLTDVAAPASLGALNVNARPFAVVLADNGTVLGAGVPNTLEQLEMLVAGARYRGAADEEPGETAGQLPSAGNGAADGPATELALFASAADATGSHDHGE